MKIKISILLIALPFVMVATVANAVEDGLGTNHVQNLKVYSDIILNGETVSSWSDVASSTLTNNSVTTGMVQDGAITETQINTSVAGDGLTGGGGSALAVGAGSGITVTADAVAVDGSVVRTNGNQTVGGVKTFSSFPVTPSLAPTTDYQAANKKYVDDKLSSSVANGTANNDTLRWNGTAWTNTATLSVDATGNTDIDGTLTIGGVTTLSNATDSSTSANGALVVTGGAGIAKNLNVGGNANVTGTMTVDGNVILGDATSDTITFTAKASGNLDMNGNTVTGLATPSATSDAATKQYVDDAINGLSWKASVKAATTAPATLTTDFVGGTDFIDGVGLQVNDRILIKNQTDPSENGIYIVTAGTPTRAADLDATADLLGAAVFVARGTVNGATAYVCTSPTIAVGTGDMTFAQFASPGTYTAGDGMNLSGLAFSVNATNLVGTGLEVNANNLQIAGAAAGDGLTGGGGSALAVGAGSGISVSADAIAVDASVIRTNTAQSISGVKTFTVSPVVPTPSGTTDAANKAYVDDKLSSSVADGTANHDTLRWNGTAWTNTAALSVDASGNTDIDGTLGVAGITTLSDTTTSTTTGTGALVVGGGIGVAENLNVGGNAGVTGNATIGGTLSVTGDATLINATATGNTTLGDAIGTDTVTVNAKAIFAGATVVTPSGELTITAAVGITATDIQNSYLKVKSNSGAVDLTVSPQIAAGTAGQMLTLQGTDNNNTLRLDDGTGLSLDGGISFTLKAGHLIQFIFDGAVWRETFRTVPAP